MNEKKLNQTLLNRKVAEEMVDHLTRGYSDFTNHPLIAEGCKQEYVWTKTDPSVDVEVLYESILKVSYLVLKIRNMNYHEMIQKYPIS